MTAIAADDARVTPITESGFGSLVRLSGALDDYDLLRETALRSGVTLVRGLSLDEDGFRSLVDGLGDTVRYEDETKAVGYGFTDVLHLSGEKEQDKVITGRGGLPLHTDGVLLGTQVDLIVLYAAELGSLGSHGATLVCDQLAAWRDLPEALRQVIDHGHLEYRAVERGYFTSVPEGWYPINTVRDYGRVRSLNLALPFASEALASWEVRVPGGDSAKSDNFFSELNTFLMQDKYLYAHEWRQGDLVIIDNQRTLHGRRGLAEESTRKLLRGQVTLSASATSVTPSGNGLC